MCLALGERDTVETTPDGGVIVAFLQRITVLSTLVPGVDADQEVQRTWLQAARALLASPLWDDERVGLPELRANFQCRAKGASGRQVVQSVPGCANCTP